MPDIVTTKHTIEFEVVVKWDLDPHGEYPHQFGIPSFVTTNRWVTSGQLEALGITRPVSPYEPQVGDIVEYSGRVNFYRVSGCHVDGDVELMDATRSIQYGKVKPSDLVFIARPEVKP
jgi:hypothetical protein